MVEADPDSSAPFKEKMDAFFREARAELANEQQALLEARGKFKAVMQFYQYKPKGTNLDAADPNAFFALWLGFCQDFKVTWKILTSLQPDPNLLRLFTGYLEEGAATNKEGTDGGDEKEVREQDEGGEVEIERNGIEGTASKIVAKVKKEKEERQKERKYIHVHA